ncbi:hypothetical protein L226DRAFT_560208 [Lentinus tigrinus ALCF2SS1-7]|uniref:Uncharacterized protein n=1 Tax=Lentinus tigrinus ALCF2SS1-6 TaxID=1328759 RepID=A0A5C2SCV7_9APHY|nr:hypothetical protein L227DRAFT_652782 [Lentinus tigrinus ALCF2SS1-6]RPD75068.1 hypothetical protein L226DRAFT_560208 [Lentinus tigrinus ALCF2SS1-7]
MLAFVPLVLSLALSAAAAAVPAEKRQGSDYPWCNALRATCEKQITNKDYEDFFAHDACLFGSACPPDFPVSANSTLTQRRNVQLFLGAVVGDLEPGREPPHSEDLRVPTSILQQISTDGKTITKQNFIDGFYHALDASSGPWPTNVDIVKGYWSYIVDWTAVCSGGIPFKNFADYFVYSSYVKSENNC